jgi:hypothetical protein
VLLLGPGFLCHNIFFLCILHGEKSPKMMFSRKKNLIWSGFLRHILKFCNIFDAYFLDFFINAEKIVGKQENYISVGIFCLFSSFFYLTIIFGVVNLSNQFSFQFFICIKK